ncbi:MAG: protein-arginine deiminase [Labilithrix sp.]|nr:protein-arginine deiminase [Labilithrix sp.]
MPRLALAAGFLVAACGGADAGEISDPTPAGPGGSGSAPPSSTSTPPGGELPGSPVDLRADTNRDGVVSFEDPTDDDGEDTWDAKHGAIFLANLDDDEVKCPTNVDDVDFPKCNDAADDVVNGEDDARDLARLATRPWPEAPADTTGSITTSAADHVRLFKVRGESFEVLGEDGALSGDEIRAGVHLAIEGRDIVRDLAKWDGFVDVVFTVRSGGASESDTVKMRVAPLITAHHLSPAETTYVSLVNTAGGVATRTDLATAATAAGVPAPQTIATQDQWTQDFFETGYMSMPGPNGTQHVMRVNIRSANMSSPQSTRNPLRRAGRVVFTHLRGKDSAGIQEYDPSRFGRFDTLNSFGNFETIPPYTRGGESFPLGRILRGSTPSYFPDKAFGRMMEAQKVQEPLYVDTSWLIVGHVDETISFVKSPSPRGWALLVNDPAAAREMLQAQADAGYGDTPMFVGKLWSTTRSAQVTINQVLANTEVMQASAEAAAEIDGQLTVIKAATGISDDEIIRVPFLWEARSSGLVAYQPGLVNGLYLAPDHFVAPNPHGPQIEGVDIFKAAMQERLAPTGVTVHFAEDWDLYHRNLGEVHCGTNATRAVPAAKWWESGR